MSSAKARKRWELKNPNYRKEYRKSNLKKLIEMDKEYYVNNKSQISKRRKEKYKNDAEYRNAILKKSKERYENNSTVAEKNKIRVVKTRELLHKILMYYKCQNKECKWAGEFVPIQLQFHHIVPSTKEYNVSGMGAYSKDKISFEINKCCVLCACCHLNVRKNKLPILGRCNVDENLNPID